MVEWAIGSAIYFFILMNGNKMENWNETFFMQRYGEHEK